MWHYGVEGRSKGPVEDDELRAMLAARLIDHRTYVWREGMEMWLPLAETPEWKDQLVSAGGRAMNAPGVVPNHGYAVTSLCCGIGSLVLIFTCMIGFLAAIPGVVFGHMALREIQRHPLPMGGRGMAIAGLIMSYLTLSLYVIGGLIFVFVLVTQGTR
ncbi:hypothetical protein Hsar01_03578 [Haloferula sargassicola]|uniref:DUF4190 domain-containing protein n=2 Tax=Haloferula sargassicola TaxID=490096 RepID=A0ABP9UW95_9BACT